MAANLYNYLGGAPVPMPAMRAFVAEAARALVAAPGLDAQRAAAAAGAPRQAYGTEYGPGGVRQRKPPSKIHVPAGEASSGAAASPADPRQPSFTGKGARQPPLPRSTTALRGALVGFGSQEPAYLRSVPTWERCV